MRVVLLEPDVELVHLLAEALGHHGFDVSPCAQMSLLPSLLEHKACAVLLDPMGLRLAELAAWFTVEPAASIPRLVHTALPRESLPALLLAGPRTLFLAKPSAPHVVAGALARLCRRAT